jgi:hypothetical protein
VFNTYPTRQPLLVQDSDLRIERRLPMQGEIQVKIGDRVEPSTIIGTGDQATRPLLVNIARELEVEPGASEERLIKQPGQPVEAGEVIAKRRRGLRTHAVRSPIAGTFIRFDPQLGTALIRPAVGRIELPAQVAGVIEEIEQGWGVTIRAFGSRFFGAVGVGEDTFGVLKMIPGDRQRPLGPEQIDSRSARAILAVGGSVSAAALAKAVQAGIRGIVAGSIEESELTNWLGAGGGALWRVGLPDWQLPTGGAPLTLVLTEGFGRTPMAQPLYDVLAAADGIPIAISGTTQLVGGLRRPEIIVPSRTGARSTENAHLPLAALEPGATVRLLDHDHLGILATVAERPRRQRLEGDLLVDALAITLPSGEALRVPTANVEVLIEARG